MTKLIDATTLRLASLEELRELNRTVVEAIRAREASVGGTFVVGDRVKFTGRSGQTVTGTVIKINAKTIKVKSIDVTWAVSPSLLTLVERASWLAKAG
jgi:hypothetical protein